jgi:hypothetical protein
VTDTSYILHIYSLPEDIVHEIPNEPSRMHAFLEAAANKVGELEFGAGESTLFFGAIEELIGIELQALLNSPIRGVHPLPDLEFGSMGPDAAAEVISAIEGFLKESDEHTPGVATVAQTYDFEPGRLVRMTRQLGEILQMAVDAGGDVVTAYTEE